MSGVEIAGELLLAHAPLIAVVPVDRIRAGELPQGVALPAILLTTVSSVDRETLSAQARRRTTDRVQVTVKAGSYAAVLAVLRLVRAACADKVGSFAGKTQVTVHLDGMGPDFKLGPESIYERSQDLLVSFNEVA